MGDRGSIGFRSDDDGEYTYLYSHWNGTELPEYLREALARPAAVNRWNDASYLARIVIQRILNTWAVDTETGWGIATQPAGDEQHPLIFVDPIEQTVEAGSSTFTFAEYIAKPAVRWGGERIEEDADAK